MGRTRIADHLCEVIRVVARDGTRYSYIVWMDTETKLPMRVDLLDRDGETLEQFRVIAFTVNQDVGSSMQTLAKPICHRCSPFLWVKKRNSVESNLASERV